MISIRDVTLICPAAGVAGTAALRDAALVVAPRIAPPGSSRARVAEIAAALILAGVEKDPREHGLTVDVDVLARAGIEYAALREASEPVEARIARVMLERDDLRARVAELEARLAAPDESRRRRS